MAPKVDPRWVRLVLLTGLVAAGCCALGLAVAYLPGGEPTPGRLYAAGVVILVAMVVGMSWIVTRAFELFDVEELSRRKP